METKIYNQSGKEAGKVILPESIFGLPWNADLVHQVVTSMMTNARIHYAHTKTRGEVRGGGKKPWKQKGTGRARHGSTRSPIWVGGGVAHGPRNDKNFDRKVNKKMKAKALYTILSQKNRDGELVFIDDVKVEGKAKNALVVLKSLSAVKGFEKLTKKRTNAAIIATASKDLLIERGFANFGSMSVSEVRNLNPIEVLNHKYLVIVNPQVSISILEARSAKK